MPILKKPYIYNISGILKGKRKERVYNTVATTYIDAPEIASPRDALSYIKQRDGKFVCYVYKEHEGKIYQPYQKYMLVGARENNINYSDYQQMYNDVIGDNPIFGMVAELKEFNLFITDNPNIGTEELIREIRSIEKTHFVRDSEIVDPDTTFKNIKSDNQSVVEKQILKDIGDCITTRETLMNKEGETECLWTSTDMPTLRVLPSTRGANISIELKTDHDPVQKSIFPLGMMDAAWKYAELLGRIDDTKPYLDSRFKAISLNPDIALPEYDDKTFHDIITSIIEYEADFSRIRMSVIVKILDQWEKTDYSDIEDFKEIVKNMSENSTNSLEKRDILFFVKNLTCAEQAISHYMELKKENKLSNFLDTTGPKQKEYIVAPKIAPQSQLKI